MVGAATCSFCVGLSCALTPTFHAGEHWIDRLGKKTDSRGADAPATLHSLARLSWIAPVAHEQGATVFVSVGRVRWVLSLYAYADLPVPRLPYGLYQMLLGRALGRIVAHEIGHYLNGPSHDASGLMKAMLSRN